MRASVFTALLATCMALGQARAPEPQAHVGGTGSETEVVHERIAASSPRLIPERTELRQARRSPDATIGPFVSVTGLALPGPNRVPALLATLRAERSGGLFARTHGARGPPSSRRS